VPKRNTFKLSTIVLATSAVISGCGGGGPSATLGGGTLPNVPYYTPVKVGTAVMSTNPIAPNSVAGAFSKDLTGSGKENLIVAGRNLDASRSPSKITIYGWADGKLVDQTSQWFSGNDNVISGTEPDIEFGDFNNDGKIDLYVAPSTDSNVTRGASGIVLINNGSSFTRTELNVGNAWAHDSVVYDFDRDGKSDIFNIDFGNDASLSISNGDGTFTTYMSSGGDFFTAASVAAADFLGNGTTSIIVTDAQTTTIQDQTRLLTYSTAGGTLTLTTSKVLPLPRFDLPAYDQYNQYNTTNQPKSHTIRSYAFDFDNSGIPSALLITSPNWTVSNYIPEKSEIQFLKNDGAGNFTDVTDSVLVGYNKMLQPDYNPQFLDINGDGLTDIFLGGETWDSNIVNTAVLLHTAEHKYVYSYAEIFTAFQNQVRDMERLVSGNWMAGGGQTSIIKGPDNTFYMVSMLSVTNPNTGAQEKAIYLSKMGQQTVSAQATASAIKQVWPYLSDSSVNQILASTSDQIFGLNALNLNKVFNPIGSLGLSVNGNKQSLTGSLAGVNLNGVTPLLFDDYNRAFAVSLPTINTSSTWFNNSDNLNQEVRSSSTLSYTEFNQVKIGADISTQSFTVGTGYKLNQNSQINIQGTKLPFSPFVNMSGSWGKVNYSYTTEVSVLTNKNNWIGKAGIMYSKTDISKGIVTNVTPITSAWAEGGYDFGNTKLFAGIFPKVIGGTVNLNMPTSVDTYGKINYNNVVAKVTNPTTGYIRLAHNKDVNKNTKVSVNAILTSTGQAKAYGEFKVQF